jgi:transcriptional regulator with XRE-family HTH domain
MDLREARFHKGFTQFDLRLKTAISQTKLSLIERGYVRPSKDDRARLVKALGLTPQDIEWPDPDAHRMV